MEAIHTVVYAFDEDTRVITNLNNDLLNLHELCSEGSYTIAEYIEDRASDGASLISSVGGRFVFSDGKTEILIEQVEQVEQDDPMILIEEIFGTRDEQELRKIALAARTNEPAEPMPRDESMGSFSILKQLEDVRGLLTVHQLIEILGPEFKQSTIYALTDRPSPAGMPCIRFGAKKMFEPATLIHWFKQHHPYMAVARKASLKAEHAAQELNRTAPRQ